MITNFLLLFYLLKKQIIILQNRIFLFTIAIKYSINAVRITAMHI